MIRDMGAESDFTSQLGVKIKIGGYGFSLSLERIPRRWNHDRASHGLVVRDARHCRAPHHEGLRPHPEEALRAVSKDEATELENALTHSHGAGRSIAIRASTSTRGRTSAY